MLVFLGALLSFPGHAHVMTAASDKPDAEALQRIRADIAQMRQDIGDVKAEIMLLRVIIENAARLMADATMEPQTDHLT